MIRLLLVDDNPSLRLTLTAVLEDAGYMVETAASFAEARRKAAHGQARFDVALLDRHLGDGTGMDLVPVFREHSPSTKIMLLSGSGGEDLALDEADASLDKGEDVETLLEALRDLRIEAP